MTCTYVQYPNRDYAISPVHHSMLKLVREEKVMRCAPVICWFTSTTEDAGSVHAWATSVLCGLHSGYPCMHGRHDRALHHSSPERPGAVRLPPRPPRPGGSGWVLSEAER